LQAITTDKGEVRSWVVSAKATASLSVPMRTNDVVLIEFSRGKKP
jgi:beta-xylosidase